MATSDEIRQAEIKALWEASQKKTFTKWCNAHLRRKGFSLIEDCEKDFGDGVLLMQLVNALYSTRIPKHKQNPELAAIKLDNIQMALGMLEEAHVKTNFLKPGHLLDSDKKMILGMMWSIILDYAIKGISEDDLTAKEGLLLWCRKKTAGYAGVDPPGLNNFSQDWKSGLAFCALIHRYQPNLINYESLDKSDAEANLELAFSVAEKQLGIPRLLDVEDLTAVPRPDERSVMTYVSEYFHKFASQDMLEKSAQRISTFVGFSMSMDAKMKAYEAEALALCHWVDRQIERFSSRDLGETRDDAQRVWADLRSYVVSEKPSKFAEMMDLESAFVAIGTELEVNNRFPFTPAEGCSPDTIAAKFSQLSVVEKEYAAACRANNFSFIKKVEKELSKEEVEDFESSFAHFDNDNSGDLTRVEFRAACSALGVAFKDDASFERVWARVSGNKEVMSKDQFFNYWKRLVEDKDTPEQVKASFLHLADQHDSIRAESLNVNPISQPEVDFLISNMPQNNDGSYNFGAFVDNVFTA